MTDYLPAATAPTPSEWDMLVHQANAIANTLMVPEAFRGNPDAILAAGLYGREIGLGLMASLQRIAVIKGKPTLDAQGMAAVILRAGHSLDGDTSATEATAIGTRADTGVTRSFTFTLDMAREAGLANGPNAHSWRKYPHSMLWARALTQLARMMFADVLAGFSYTAEELGSVGDDDDEPVAPPHIPVAAGPATVTAAATVTSIERTTPVKPEVEAEPAPPYEGPRGLSKAKNILFHTRLEDMDCDEPTYRAALEAIYGDDARGEPDANGEIVYSVKHLPRPKAESLLKALGNPEKQGPFITKGLDLLAERHEAAAQVVDA